MLIEKLIVTQSRNLLPFMDSEVSLPRSQAPANGFCIEPDKYSP
jgi:hypothetical protein